MVQLLRKHTGRGPTQARTTMARDQVVIVLRDTLTTAERTLVDAGHNDLVLDGRKTMQSIMRTEAVQMVEDTTGRTVVGFMSDNHIDPDLGVEVFITEPVDHEPVEADGGDLSSR
jgi:uncharacterized protein YbcI